MKVSYNRDDEKMDLPSSASSAVSIIYNNDSNDDDLKTEMKNGNVATYYCGSRALNQVCMLFTCYLTLSNHMMFW